MSFDQSINVKFVKVVCRFCKEENIIFTRATTRLKCPKCGWPHTIPTGGKCKLINCTKVDDLR